MVAVSGSTWRASRNPGSAPPKGSQPPAFGVRSWRSLHGSEPLETSRRPMVLETVELRNAWYIGRKGQPRHLRRGVDVDVRSQAIRVVQGPDSYKMNAFAHARIVAPQGDPAYWTSVDLLALPTLRWGVDDLHAPAQELDSVCFDQGIQDKSRARLPLAPPAVTAVNEKGRGGQVVSNVAAGAAAFGCFELSCVHDPQDSIRPESRV
jgi:hypothetical protein